MDSRTRVVITGIGPISSVGTGKENFWQGILDNKTNVELEKSLVDDRIWAEFYLHKIRHFDISEFGVDKEKLEDIKIWKEGEEVTDLNYLIAAIKLALDDSRIDYRRGDNDLGLVLAHENIGLMPFVLKISDIAYDMLIDKERAGLSKIDFFDKFYKRFLKSGYDIQTFADLFHVARVFNAQNYSLFLNNACASGLYAFEAASQIIKNNQAKKVVVASSDQPEIYKYLWFRDLGIYSPDGIIRPFCRDSKGLVFGEAGIAVVLEEFESARQRNADIYAEYLGGGFNLEGWKITVPEIGSDSYQKAISQAFLHSRVDKDKISLVCPHGVGSQPIDYYESKAITDTFGKNPQTPLITTFKPYVGHSLGASALLEAAIMLLSLKNGVIPPTLNIDTLDPKFNISLVNEKTTTDIEYAMKICCAFAGFNSAVIFKKI